MRSVCVPRPDSSRLWRGRRFCLHIVRRSCFTFSLIGAAAGVFGWRGPARATDYFWITPAGGVFTNSANWKSDTLQPGPGGALDTVNFNQSIPVANRYTVTGVTGQNLQLSVLDDSLTLDLSGNYTLQDFLTGISAGDTADVILTGSGTLQTTLDGRIGDGTGSVGVVTVDDLQWIDNHALIVGNFGAGTLTVQNGGSVSNTDGTIGFGGVMGDVTVTGTGSTWTNSAELQVGGANHSAGTLTIQSGGSVSSDTAILGRDNGSDGAVNVSGATWSNNGALTVGKFGHGSLIINSNGDVSSAGGTVGFNSQFGGDGFVRVSGSGATWTDNGDLTIGDAGTGSLEIFTGGHVSDINGFVGKQAGSSGTVSIVGATWTNSGSLEVGAAGMGTLNINSRSVVSNTGGFIGNDAGSMGNVNVSGANGKWLNSFGLSVGFQGIGTLDVTAGGFVSSLNGHIGSESGSSGTVTVSGAGSKWLSTTMDDFDFNVGRDGTGTLSIQNGGEVESTSAVIGFHIGSEGTATVEGPGSTWINHGPSLLVGFAGAGSLNILDGGAVSDGNGFLGAAGAAVGNVTVDGSGSTWTNSGDVGVGGDGSGTLAITGGGAVSDTNGFVSALVGIDHPPAEATIDGEGSTWISSDSLVVGGILCPDCGAPDFEGRLTIQNGGQVSDIHGFIASDPGSVGTATIGGHGFGPPPPTSTWTNQILSLGGDVVFGGGEGGVAELTILSGGTVIADDTVLFSNATLRLLGGTLDCAGISDQDGGVFDFLGGTLHVENFLGDLVNQGGKLAPGGATSFTTNTTISGDYTQQAGATLAIDIGGTAFGSEVDEVEVTGSAALDGLLQVSLINDFVPDASNIFVVLTTASLSGAFSNIANGDRLDTLDGLGSFIVSYGPGSIFNPDRVILSDFELAALPGDFNSDGKVDAADYVMWRKTDGTQAGYDLWRANYGATAGSGSVAVTTIPEPASLMLAAAGVLLIATVHQLTRIPISGGSNNR